MSWIRSIGHSEAQGDLRRIYDRIAGPDGYIDNILTIHGQRPNTLEGHMALYKNVLHSRHNRLPKWQLELLGVYTSLLNGCEYCVAHHHTGMRRLLNDDARADAMRATLERDAADRSPERAPGLASAAPFDAREAAMLAYTRRLTLAPHAMAAGDVEALKAVGFDDGEVLEINQVVSYFAYVNRTALGLGVSLDGDRLGLSPGDSDDPDNWHHVEARE